MTAKTSEACSNAGSVDDYVAVMERMAADPDTPPSPEDRAIFKQYAIQGAYIGLQHGGPAIVSVDADFMRRASGC